MTQVSVRFRVDFGPNCALGPGKIALLECIERTGSLAEAARTLRMSYRRAWLLLEDMNTSFQERVTHMSVGGRGGGGATLTPFGHDLIRAYRELQVHIQQCAETAFPAVAPAASTPRSQAKSGSRRRLSRTVTATPRSRTRR